MLRTVKLLPALPAWLFHKTCATRGSGELVAACRRPYTPARAHRLGGARAASHTEMSKTIRMVPTYSVYEGVIALVPGIMRLFWAFSPSNPPESPSQEESSLANMPDTLEARCRSDGPPAGPRSIDPLPGSRSFLTVSAVA